MKSQLDKYKTGSFEIDLLNQKELSEIKVILDLLITTTNKLDKELKETSGLKIKFENIFEKEAHEISKIDIHNRQTIHNAWKVNESKNDELKAKSEKLHNDIKFLELYIKLRFFDRIPQYNSHILQLINNHDLLKTKIREKQDLPKIFLFLDEVERDLKELIDEINKTTYPKLLDVGEYSPEQISEDSWIENYNLNSTKTPNDIYILYYGTKEITNSQAILEANEWNTKNVIPLTEESNYLTKYNSEIKLIGQIYDTLDFINSEKDYYKEQLYKYSVNGFTEQNVDSLIEKKPISDSNRKLEQLKAESIDKKTIESYKYKPTPKLLLTPNKKEILNEKIVNAVNDFFCCGKGSQQQAYIKLSKKSKKLFGYQLTPKQLEGRFSRNKKKYS